MKALKLFGAIFALIGAGLLTGSYYSFSSTRDFVAGAASARGTVIENRYSRSSSSNSSGTYYPLIKFKMEAGREVTFQGDVGSSPPSFSEGEEMDVYYNPANPEEAKVNTFFQLWFAAVLLGVMGSVFFLIGGGILVAGPLRARKNIWLRENGQKIQTKISAVDLNTSLRVNGRHPYVITSQWTDPHTNTVRVFQSESIWFDPREFIRGEAIGVFIDPNNPNKYFVDISFLPKVVD